MDMCVGKKVPEFMNPSVSDVNKVLNDFVYIYFKAGYIENRPLSMIDNQIMKLKYTSNILSH